MSLEERITELTEAVRALTVAMSTVGNPFPAKTADATAAEPPKRGPGRPKKDTEPAAGPIPETGDPAGTTYFYNAEHSTVFSLKPGEANTGLAGVAISPAEFVQKRDALAKADPFAEQSAGADPFAEATAPTEPPKTLADVTAKLKEIDKSKLGRAGVAAALSKFGATNIGGLAGKDMNEVFAEAHRVLLTAPL